MDNNDRKLIDDLAAELAKAQPVTKDPEAAALIAQRVASQPDAVYLLTQAVLLQQAGLRAAQAELTQLRAQQQNRGGGLFSGLFGGGGFGQPQPQQYARQQPYFAQRGSSSFLSQAASTAAGVAGGMFLFEGLESLFGGGFGGGFGGEGAFEQGYDQGFDNGFDQGQDDGGQTDAGQGSGDQGFDQAGWDDGGFDGGGFDGGGDWNV